MAGEALVQKKVLGALKERGAYAVKVHGSNYQPKTIDIIACYRGLFIGIETKARPGLRPTTRQRMTLEEISKAGGEAHLVTDASQITDLLDGLDSLFDDD